MHVAANGAAFALLAARDPVMFTSTACQQPALLYVKMTTASAISNGTVIYIAVTLSWEA